MGAAGGVAGLAGCEVFTPSSTELGPDLRCAITESVIEVSMKMIADQVVAFESAVAVPRGPKAVWLPWPPKAAAMSPLLPLCSRTTMIRNRQTKTWTMVRRVIIFFSLGISMVRKGGFEPPRLAAPPPQDGVSASSTTSARYSFSDAFKRVIAHCVVSIMVSRPANYCKLRC